MAARVISVRLLFYSVQILDIDERWYMKSAHDRTSLSLHTDTEKEKALPIKPVTRAKLGTPTATPATANVRSQRMAKLNMGSTLTMEEGVAVSTVTRTGCNKAVVGWWTCNVKQTQRQMPVH
jgi:hypothetical protein